MAGVVAFVPSKHMLTRGFRTHPTDAASQSPFSSSCGKPKAHEELHLGLPPGVESTLSSYQASRSGLCHGLQSGVTGRYSLGHDARVAWCSQAATHAARGATRYLEECYGSSRVSASFRRRSGPFHRRQLRAAVCPGQDPARRTDRNRDGMARAPCSGCSRSSRSRSSRCATWTRRWWPRPPR